MKLVCIGRNYAKHIEELANERPEHPIVFFKPESSILPDGEPFTIPSFSDDIHYEVEVLVKINQNGKNIAEGDADKYYDEIGLGIDFTARDVQQHCKEKGHPWEKAKCFDGSAVIGDFYPKQDFDVDNIAFQLLHNDTVVQDASTAEMLWKVNELIAYVSQYFTLCKGDVIFTGTPAGVGRVMPNDELVGCVEGKRALHVHIKEEL